MVYSREQIRDFIEELIIEPRKNCAKWSRITNQTATLRIGYPGQHLASLVTGVKGEKTGARGNDLADGSEVKSCSRVDQLGKCKSCNQPISRWEKKCGNCNSTDIIRKDDSKWLFTIRSEEELKTLIDNPNLDRIILIIDDYPGFNDGNFENIRIQIFEIWPKKKRHSRFKEIISNYYYKIYLEHRKKDPTKTPAPKNFWPFQFQFYLCNPIIIFEAIIIGAYTETPKLVIENWVQPDQDRDQIESVIMPPKILKMEEFVQIYKIANREDVIKCLKPGVSFNEFASIMTQNGELNDIQNLFQGINEKLKNCLTLRDTDKISTAKNKYERRSRVE